MISNITDSKLAPIALFVFKRPEHTQQALMALSANPEFFSSPLFIYCDGARGADDARNVERTRELVRNFKHPAKTIIEAERNRGLAESVIAGVTELVTRFGQVIVVEDDLVVNAGFLCYLNTVLEIYRDSPQVMQVSAYMFPIPELAEKRETLFLPNISSWGWATWSRAWKHFDAEGKGWNSLLCSANLRHRFNVNGAYDYSDMLLRQMSGEIDSWAIRWNWSVFRHGGLVSYPPVSFVKNIGFDGSGTHCRTDNFHGLSVSALSAKLAFATRIEISPQDVRLVRSALLAMSGSQPVRALKVMRSCLRRILLKWLSANSANGLCSQSKLNRKK
jgi:hypothetical protein